MVFDSSLATSFPVPLDVLHHLTLNLDSSRPDLFSWLLSDPHFKNCDEAKLVAGCLLLSACKAGSTLSAGWAIEQGAEPSIVAGDLAAQGGHLEIVKLIYELCSKDLKDGTVNPANFALAGACKGDQLEVAEWAAKQGADNWDEALAFACRNGTRRLIDLAVQHGAQSWDYGLREACSGGHPDMIDCCLANGAEDLHGAFERACRGGDLRMSNYIMDVPALNDKFITTTFKIEAHWMVPRTFADEIDYGASRIEQLQEILKALNLLNEGFLTTLIAEYVVSLAEPRCGRPIDVIRSTDVIFEQMQ